jgi:hypothetical protein
LLIALAFAAAPAQARDPKSGALRSNAVFAAARPTQPIGAQPASVADRRSNVHHEHETPSDERKPLTLFRFNSRLGELAVQPAIGSVKGAQLSLGF